MEEGHLLWNSEPREYPGESRYYFVFNPVMGLLDINSHRILNDAWKHMSAKDSEATAHLIAPQFATLKEIQGAVTIISSMGGFKRIRITIENSGRSL